MKNAYGTFDYTNWLTSFYPVLLHRKQGRLYRTNAHVIQVIVILPVHPHTCTNKIQYFSSWAFELYAPLKCNKMLLLRKWTIRTLASTILCSMIKCYRGHVMHDPGLVQTTCDLTYCVLHLSKINTATVKPYLWDFNFKSDQHAFRPCAPNPGHQRWQKYVGFKFHRTVLASRKMIPRCTTANQHSVGHLSACVISGTVFYMSGFRDLK